LSIRPPVPSLVSGTSAEYLGRRPLRKLLVERPVVLVLGPHGVGKTSVARRIGSHKGRSYVYLDTKALEKALEQTARGSGRWPPEIYEADALVLDGPTYLHARRTALDFLARLVLKRAEEGRATIVCEVDDDGSAQSLQAKVPPGQMVTVALRFPRSRSGRMRVARRIAERMGLEKSAAQGTDTIEPWRYDAVTTELRRRRDAGRDGASAHALED